MYQFERHQPCPQTASAYSIDRWVPCVPSQAALCGSSSSSYRPAWSEINLCLLERRLPQDRPRRSCFEGWGEVARCQNAASWPMWGGQRLVGYGDGPGGYQGDLWVGVRICARKSYSGLGGCLTACFLDQHNQSCYCFACDLYLTKTARA